MQRAFEASDRYGRNHIAYSKLDRSAAAQFTRSERPPHLDEVYYKDPKPIDCKCSHSFCLLNHEEVHKRHKPL